MLERQLLQHLLRRALLAPGRLLERRQLQLVEEDLAELGTELMLNVRPAAR